METRERSSAITWNWTRERSSAITWKHVSDRQRLYGNTWVIVSVYMETREWSSAIIWKTPERSSAIIWKNVSDRYRLYGKTWAILRFSDSRLNLINKLNKLKLKNCLFPDLSRLECSKTKIKVAPVINAKRICNVKRHEHVELQLAKTRSKRCRLGENFQPYKRTCWANVSPCSYLEPSVLTLDPTLLWRKKLNISVKHTCTWLWSGDGVAWF